MHQIPTVTVEGVPDPMPDGLVVSALLLWVSP